MFSEMQGYELVERSVEGDIDVAKLRQEVTGSLFQVYAFNAPLMREYEDLCQQVESIPRPISRVVSIARDLNAGYIMTELLPEGTGIRNWIHGLATPSQQRGSVESAGERLFRIAQEMRERRIEKDLATTSYQHAAPSSIAAGPAVYREPVSQPESAVDDNTVFFQSEDDLPTVAGLAEAATLLFAPGGK